MTTDRPTANPNHNQACHDADIYLLGPMEAVHVAACTGATIVLVRVFIGF